MTTLLTRRARIGMDEIQHPDRVLSSRHGVASDAGSGDQLPASGVARLLRACRESRQLTLRQVRDRTGLAQPTISQFETGARMPAESAVAKLDAAYHQQGVLSGVVRAARRAAAVPVDTWWSFHPTEAPAFAWVRLPEGAIGRAHMTWGPWRLTCDVEGDTGVAVVSAVVFPNPPLIVELEPAGRVDVINGTPPAWLTPNVLDALDEIDVQSTPHTTIRIVARLLKEAGSDSGHRRAMLTPHLARRILTSVRTLQRIEPQEIPAQTLPEASNGESGLLAQQARLAEGLSVVDLVQRCRELPGSSGLTTLSRVRSFEEGSAAAPDVVGELDVALGLGGRLGPSLVSSAIDVSNVSFPSAYIGPVWLELEPARAPSAEVKLRWGRYQKRIRAAQAARVWLTKSWPGDDDALEVRADGWRLRAGIGRIPGAHDVHIDWSVDYDFWKDEIGRKVKEFLTSQRVHPGGSRGGDDQAA